MFPTEYPQLTKSTYNDGEYSICPIRFEDRFLIMQWRNEQMYHLRQATPLTIESQNYYFSNVVANIFSEEQPTQLLFSFLKNEKLIGYGGLVHINWIDRNAEISFVMETLLEDDYFEENWNQYLKLIEQIAFKELKLHKIFTFAFDLRPHLYSIFETNNYIKEAELMDHVLVEDSFINVIIHAKINNL